MLKAFESSVYKTKLIEVLGQQEYDKQHKSLKDLAAADAVMSKWEPIKNELELRS